MEIFIIRDEFKNETNKVCYSNIGAYADWLEKKLIACIKDIKPGHLILNAINLMEGYEPDYRKIMTKQHGGKWIVKEAVLRIIKKYLENSK